MKKHLLFLSVLTLIIFTLSSCNTYQSIRSAKNVRQLSANPFMQKVARSVIQNISNDIISKGLTSFKGKPLLKSNMNSLLNTPQSVSTLKSMLTNKYGIPNYTVEANYNKMTTVRDLIGFVAKKGKKYNFNSYSNKLL